MLRLMLINDIIVISLRRMRLPVLLRRTVNVGMIFKQHIAYDMMIWERNVLNCVRVYLSYKIICIFFVYHAIRRFCIYRIVPRIDHLKQTILQIMMPIDEIRDTWYVIPENIIILSNNIF